MSKEKQDIYQKVTDRIVAGLNQKGLTWFRPWTSNGMTGPINNSTGRSYKGINVLLLCAEVVEHGYEHNEWVTYKQAAAKGGNVKKGSQSTFIVFWNIIYKCVDSGKTYRKLQDVPVGMRYTKLFFPRAFNVFNIDQCEGLEPRREKVEVTGEFNPIEQAESIYKEQYPKEMRPTLAHGGDSAFYVPSKHHVQMPKQETFVSSDDYYKVLFHELVHSTGHETILKRLDKVAAFGGDAYSKEELVAEIGAQFLVGLTGIQPKDDETNSQAYINGWVKKLQDQPKMALSAANKAMKAVDFITGEGADAPSS